MNRLLARRLMKLASSQDKESDDLGKVPDAALPNPLAGSVRLISLTALVLPEFTKMPQNMQRGVTAPGGAMNQSCSVATESFGMRAVSEPRPLA